MTGETSTISADVFGPPLAICFQVVLLVDIVIANQTEIFEAQVSGALTMFLDPTRTHWSISVHGA